MEPLNELLELIPKKAISGLMSYQQHLTSVTAKDEFIFIGTNLGVVYVLEKFCGILSKIHAEVYLVYKDCTDQHCIVLKLNTKFNLWRIIGNLDL